MDYEPEVDDYVIWDRGEYGTDDDPPEIRGDQANYSERYLEQPEVYDPWLGGQYKWRKNKPRATVDQGYKKQYFDGSTFGGNVLTCAAAHASTQFIINNEIPAKADDMGKYLMGKLLDLKETHSLITEVRGVGLLIAVEFNREISANLLTYCNQLGLLLNAPKPTAIRLMPPLTISKQEVDIGIQRLESGILKAQKE